MNRNFLDVDIYVVAAGEATRLGSVTGLTTHVLPVPAGLVQPSTELQFRANAVGSRGSALSLSVLASPGDTLQIEIPAAPF